MQQVDETSADIGRASAARGVRYEEVECKSVINRVKGMPFKWSINPYKGCVHGCHYCYARRYHASIDLNAGEDFTGLILVRANAPEVLRRELAHRSWKRETVALGTATDPYQPIEGRYRITRGHLGGPARLPHPGQHRHQGHDDRPRPRHPRRTGPAAPGPRSPCRSPRWTATPGGGSSRARPRRGSAFGRYRSSPRRGVEAGVLIAPIVPGITDTSDHLRELVKSAADHGARFVGSRVLALQGSVKEHFLGFMRSEYPSLLAEYRRLFPGANADRDYASATVGYVDGLRRLYRVGERTARDVVRPPEQPRQLSLAL